MRFSYAATLVLLTAAVLFAPAVRYDFVYEDARDAHMTLNPADTARQIGANPFRSLLLLSRAADLSVFGVQPWGFHLSSIGWHLLNVLALFAVAWLLLPPWGAIAAAGIFAWHPIQVEAVAYVSARGDLLAAGGVLLAMLSASRGSVAGAVVGVTVACLSKEAAIVAWGLVPLWAAWTRAPFPWVKWTAIGGAAGAVAVLTMQQRIEAAGVIVSPALIGEQIAVIWRLIALVFVPYGFTVDHDWAALVWLGPVALIASLGLTAWALSEGWWGRHWLAFAWLWTLLALAPRLFVPLYEGLHEHHFVIPMIGWSLCAGRWLSGRSNRVGEGF